MTTPTQIRIDSNVKKDVSVLFKSLGLDMSGAINLFLRQCLIHGGLPFAIENPKYKKETFVAMDEAKKISADPAIKSYKSLDELNKALDQGE